MTELHLYTFFFLKEQNALQIASNSAFYTHTHTLKELEGPSSET